MQWSLDFRSMNMETRSKMWKRQSKPTCTASKRNSSTLSPATSLCRHFNLALFCSPNKESIPFAVIGSNTVVEAKGKRVRGRLYPWGIVEGRPAPSPPPSRERTVRL